MKLFLVVLILDVNMVKLCGAISLRLQGPLSANGTGRVEVFHQGQWGTICDDLWDICDAKVVCRQLGYQYAVRALQGSLVPNGTGQIWLDEVDCTGNEKNLSNCSHSGWGVHNCNHDEDAGVECSSTEPSFSVLFPRHSIEDYVEVDDPDLPELSAFSICAWAKFVKNEGGTILSYAVPTEDNEIAIWCYTTQVIFSITNVWTRTYNSLLSDGFWHSICLTWSNVDGNLTVYKDNVMTDQASGVVTGKNISGGGRWVLGQDQDSVGGGFAIKDAFQGELAEVNVWGRVLTKQEIAWFSTDCQRRMNGDVKNWPEFRTGLRREVRAVDEPSCTKSISLRLQGPLSANGTGRVEVFHQGQWGTICDDFWDISDAKVVCRQLGYHYAVRALQGSLVPDGTGQIWLDNVGCAGNEKNLSNCFHSGWGVNNCYHSEDAGVECSSTVVLLTIGFSNPLRMTVVEGSNVVLTVEVIGQLTTQISATATVSPASASDADFNVLNSSTELTFSPGVTKDTIVIATKDDSITEVDEVFVVTLSATNPNVQIDKAKGVTTVTINDNDAPDPSSTSSSNSNTWVIVGAVAASVVVIVTSILIGVYCFRQRNRRSKETAKDIGQLENPAFVGVGQPSVQPPQIFDSENSHCEQPALYADLNSSERDTMDANYESLHNYEKVDF